jgi:methionine sulfoxide reductase heme-binding subunit
VSRLSALTVDRYKPVLLLLGLLPLLRWFWLGWQGELTANPMEFLTRSSGTWALVCLLVTLSVSPIRDVLNQPALIRLRRTCGLFAFFYAALHAITWAWWDQGFVVGSMWRDVIDRPFITVGMLAFLALLVLALTSNQRAMRELGKRWKTLHRLIYLIGALVILHYWWHKSGKNDYTEVLVYGAVMLLLLAWRLAGPWLIARFRPETKKASAS